MKRIISVFLAIVMFVSTSVITLAADDYSSQCDSFTYVNEEGEIVYCTTLCIEGLATAKVYVDGVLTQYSVADSEAKTIDTVVYGLVLTNGMARLADVDASVTTSNGFVSTVTHMPLSDETITITDTPMLLANVNDEPVENTGLTASEDDEDYYYLGMYGGLYYAPNVYGYLYRTYTRKYDGLTHSWSWGPSDTLSAIMAYLALFGAPISAVIGLLAFGANELLAYHQSVELETYTFDYSYKVRVNGDVYFTTGRNITYWRVENVTEGTTVWDLESQL